MFNFFSKKLDSVLDQSKLIKVCGVVFRIKKINPLNYVEGTLAIQSFFQTYEQKRESAKATDFDMVKKHYSDVFLASVIEPSICRKKEESTDNITWVENLFSDWDLANGLYEKITEYSYGKKKIK